MTGTPCLKTRCAAIALCALTYAPAFARDFFTGDQLYEHCDAPKTTEMYGACFGYSIGVASAFIDSGIFCLPEASIQARQVEDVVRLYLTNHPEQRHGSAATLVIEALKEKFPCH